MDKVQSAIESIKDIWAHASATGNVMAPEDLVKGRLEVCGACKHLNGTRCGKCGCFINIKSSLTATKCPLGIWEAKLVEKIAMGAYYSPKIDEYLYTGGCCG